MLEKFLNKRVCISVREIGCIKGTVTNMNKDFIELDNNKTVNIKYVKYIQCI